MSNSHFIPCPTDAIPEVASSRPHLRLVADNDSAENGFMTASANT